MGDCGFKKINSDQTPGVMKKLHQMDIYLGV